MRRKPKWLALLLVLGLVLAACGDGDSGDSTTTRRRRGGSDDDGCAERRSRQPRPLKTREGTSPPTSASISRPAPSPLVSCPT